MVIMMGGTVLAENVAQGFMTGRAETDELDARHWESRTVKQGRKQKEIGATQIQMEKGRKDNTERAQDDRMTG